MSDNEFLSALFGALPVPTYVVDSDLRILYFNEAAMGGATQAGFDRDRVIGRLFREAFPFVPESLDERFRHVLRTGETVTDEAHYQVGDRSYVVEATRFPIAMGGTPKYVGVVYRDVTELRQAQHEITASEETARALMNSSSESMFLVGEDERLIAANATAAERLGVPPEKLEGRSIDDITPPDVAASRLANFRRVRDTGEPFRFTDERMGRTYDITMFPVPSKTGGPRRVAIYARDVSEKEAMIRALRTSERRFRELFDQTPVPTYVWRWDGTTMVLRDANRAAEKITEGKVIGLLGTTVEQLYSQRHPSIVQDLHACYREKSHIVRELQYKMVTVDREGYFEAHYVPVEPDEVMVHTVDLTARRGAELELQKSYAQLEQRVAERTRELAELNEQLRMEREALNQKNAALRELIAHVNESRTDMAETIQANLQHVVGPLLNSLESRLDKSNAASVRFLRESLEDLLSPHLLELHRDHPKLTAHEIDLCNLIRSGKSCKEIAELRGRSEQTILKQRKAIRRKLGLKDKKVSLRDFLTSGSFKR